MIHLISVSRGLQKRLDEKTIFTSTLCSRGSSGSLLNISEAKVFSFFHKILRLLWESTKVQGRELNFVAAGCHGIVFYSPIVKLPSLTGLTYLPHDTMGLFYINCKIPFFIHETLHKAKKDNKI